MHLHFWRDAIDTPPQGRIQSVTGLVSKPLQDILRGVLRVVAHVVDEGADLVGKAVVGDLLEGACLGDHFVFCAFIIGNVFLSC